MAIIRTSSIVAAISGSVGGVTFANAKRGLVARHRPNHTRSQSESTLNARAKFARITQTWTTLTTEQRTAWNAIASSLPTTNRLGVSSTPTGFAYFTRFNLPLLQFQDDLRLDPPEAIAGYQDVDFELLFFDSPFYIVNWFLSGTTAGQFYIMYGTRHFSPTIPAFPKNWRIISTGVTGNGPTEGANVTTSWQAALGTLALGEAFSVRMQFHNNAFTLHPGVPLTLSSTVQAL